jgi:hypothetical protein
MVRNCTCVGGHVIRYLHRALFQLLYRYELNPNVQCTSSCAGTVYHYFQTRQEFGGGRSVGALLLSLILFSGIQGALLLSLLTRVQYYLVHRSTFTSLYCY